MNKDTTFYEWLMEHAKRDDLVGDLARDARYEFKRGRILPSWNTTHPKANSLPFDACEGACDALKEAIHEYRWMQRGILGGGG